MIKPSFIIILLIWCTIPSFAQPTISFTFDDGITNDMPNYLFEEWNEMLLDHLDNADIKAVFFSMGFNKLDEKGKFLLKSWNDRGHKIANHSFAHSSYTNRNMTFEQFSQDFLANDSIINKYSNYIRLFRFPYLKEGETKEKVEQFRTFLKKQHYKNGSVTIDASDWYISDRLRIRLKQNSKANIEGFRKYYMDHLYDRAVFYENIAYQLTGRHIKHTLLLHHNLTSALFLGDLINMFKERGWRIINAEDAFKDRIFKSMPTYLPAGESIIWALAKQSGLFEAILRYPAEDDIYEKEKMDRLGL